MRMFRLFAIAAAALLFAGVAAAQQPIKIGMSMPQTGALGAGGKAALLALQMWVEDVNAKGGLLGRKVEFIVYDDQTNPALTPAIYTKLLDVDKVDLLIAPYGTVPTAPIMPLVKQRDLLLMGNFSFQVNRTVKHDKWFNNSPWNDAESWSAGFFGAAAKLGAKSIAFLAADQEFAQNLANGARELAKKAGPADRLQPELPADDGRLLVDDPRHPRGAARHRVRDVVPERLGGDRARGERDRRRRLGQALRRRHGGPAVHAGHGIARLAR